MTFFLAGVALLAAAAAVEPSCRASESGKSLDFWLGDWVVTSEDGSTTFGANSVDLALDGCAIFERWKGASGGEGNSLFAFDARKGAWEQVWVTGDTSKAGGLKHKKLIDAKDGVAIFQGEIISDSGEPYLDRTTLTRLDDGRVRQLIEISTDGGKNWRATFDGYYAKDAGDPPTDR